MADDRRMTTDRFYGGVTNRLENLRAMLEYVRNNGPSRSQLNNWVLSNTQAGSGDAVSHHLTFLESIELIELSETECKLDEYGKQWLDDQSHETLYEALSYGVKGFDTILKSLQEGSMTDEDIMDLLVDEFEEAEMSTPGPATRHREWLQVLGYVERNGDTNQLTEEGQNLIQLNKRETVTNYSLGSSEDVIFNDKPLLGEEFTAEVVTVASNEVGRVSVKNKTIIIGPVSCDEGTEVDLEYLGKGFARCLEDSIKAENYDVRFDILKKDYDSLPVNIGGKYNGRVVESYSGSSIVNVHGIHVNTGVPELEVGQNVRIVITDFTTQSANGEVIEKVNSEPETGEVDAPSEEKNPGLYLIPVSDYWRDKFRRSVENPLDLSQYENVPPELEAYEKLRIWATTETDGDTKQAAIDKMQTGDCVLFYYEGEFFAGGTVERAFENPNVGDLIWNQPESRHIYILDEYTEDVPSIQQVWDWLKYEGRQVVRGFSRVAEDRLTEFREEHGSIQSVLFESEQEVSENDRDEENELDEIPEVGETYTAKIHRVSSSGNGIIETKYGHLNLGPVTKDSVGETVTVTIVEEHDGPYPELNPVDSSNPVDVSNTNKTLFAVPYGVSKPNPPQIQSPTSYKQSGDIETQISTTGHVEFCDECGSLMRTHEDQWVCSSCGYEKEEETQTTVQSEEEKPDLSEHEPSESEIDIENTSEGIETSPDSVGEDSEQPTKQDAEQENAGTQTAKTTEVDMDTLRKQAEQDAVEEVSQDVSTTTTTQKQQYNRSQKVKDYVKARADGVCEGCGEPAPFRSKTGEPYLHVHHIFELSDGGSDTPDTVVALCPNCHYRVHHGEDGEEYNQELLDVVQEKEREIQ